MIHPEPTCRNPLHNFTISSSVSVDDPPIVEVVDEFVPVDLDSGEEDGIAGEEEEEEDVVGLTEVSGAEQADPDFIPCREISFHLCFVILQIIYGSYVGVVMCVFPSWRPEKANQVVGIVVFVSAVLGLLFLILEIFRRLLATIVPIFGQQSRCCVQNVSRSRFLAIVASLCFVPFFAHGTYYAFNIPGHPNYAMATLCVVGLVCNVNCNLVCCIWIAPSYAQDHQFNPVLDEWYADSDVHSEEEDTRTYMRPTVVEI